MQSHLRALLVLALCLFAGGASAEDPAVCEEPHDLDKYALLRRLSLDLRGRIPSIEEYEALDAAEDVPPATIQAFLESDDFRLSMRRYHESMFWPNITPTKLHDVETLLTDTKETYAWRIYSGNRTKTLRNHASAGCDDYEQVHFDPAYPGEYRPDLAHVDVDENGVLHEGWRWVHPFWSADPNEKIKVCAFDAQETVTADDKDTTVPCNSLAGRKIRACGCGPSLRSCYPTGNAVDNAIKGALREQMALLVDEVSAFGRPYTDLLLSTKAKENGRIAFWKKHLSPSVELNITYNAPDPGEPVPDKAYFDDTWTEIDRGPMHAGVLTLPVYLLRFQTNRGRADRFRSDFTCQYFVPPEKLNPESGCSETDPDITKRCNCQYCHKTLEPLASHFGLFAEAGTTLMADTSVFPKANPLCVGDKPSPFCGRFYVTVPEAHNAGSLLSYQFADVHPEYADNIEAGPRKLAQGIVDDGAFARCAVKRLFSHLNNREMAVVGVDTDELDALEELSKGFVAMNYDLRWLVQEIVTLPQYRRIH